MISRPMKSPWEAPTRRGGAAETTQNIPGKQESALVSSKEVAAQHVRAPVVPIQESLVSIIRRRCEEDKCPRAPKSVTALKS